ncbi:MAG: hypothetical protein WCC06_06570 [Candidatus Aminicenantales bacterium]
MKKNLSFLLAAPLLLFFAACGKKGPIYPPLVLIPQPVEILRVFQRGDKIFLQWVNPTAYIDGRSLSGISLIEVWVYEAADSSSEEARAIPIEEFEKKARLAAVIKKEEFLTFRKEGGPPEGEFQYVFPLTGKSLGGCQWAFAIRVMDAGKKKSEFSRIIALRPQALSLPPFQVEAAVFEDRIELKWAAPQENTDRSTPAAVKGYNIYRAEGENMPRLLNSAPVSDTQHGDKEFLFGRNYRYFIRASASESAPYLESEDSAVIEVLPRDVFAPAPPSGLEAVSSTGLVTLIWEANREKDIAGYKVWRKEEGRDACVLLTPEPILENTFTDTAVEKGRRYEYAITALDRSGNESQKSEPVVEITEDEAP